MPGGTCKGRREHQHALGPHFFGGRACRLASACVSSGKHRCPLTPCMLCPRPPCMVSHLRVSSQLGIDGPPPAVHQPCRLAHVAYRRAQLEANGAVGAARSLGAAATGGQAERVVVGATHQLLWAGMRCLSSVTSATRRHQRHSLRHPAPIPNGHRRRTGRMCLRRGMQSAAGRPAQFALQGWGCRAGRRPGWAVCRGPLPLTRR